MSLLTIIEKGELEKNTNDCLPFFHLSSLRNWQNPCCSCRCFPHFYWKHFTDEDFTTSISKSLQCLCSHCVEFFFLILKPVTFLLQFRSLWDLCCLSTLVTNDRFFVKSLRPWITGWERYRYFKSICYRGHFFPLKMTSSLLMLGLMLCQKGKIPYKKLEWIVLQHKCHHTGQNSNPCHQCPHSLGFKFLLLELISLYHMSLRAVSKESCFNKAI